MAVEWTITIEGKNEFGDVCRKAVRIGVGARIRFQRFGIGAGIRKCAEFGL